MPSFLRAIAAFLAIATVFIRADVARAAGVQTVPVRQNGIVGELHFPAGARHLTTVIMLNGSDGGTPPTTDATDLARSGVTVLALAYFKNWAGQPEGVPPTLAEIPLEYFDAAIDWLKTQPQVDPRKLVVMGQSRGAELALLLGARRPDIAGVIAFSPSSDIWHAVGQADRAAWTVGGKPVPYRASAAGDTLSPYDRFIKAPPAAAARIPVERITGPVLLFASKTDGVWPASAYATEIAEALRKAGRRVENVQFEDASHLLMGTGPGMTKFLIPGRNIAVDFGGSPEGNAEARASAWATVKRYLADLPSR